jgi:two-component system sensor histidine kinase/response regulator
MTAAATEEIRQKCLEAGMDDYLSKPLGDEELHDALDRGLGAGVQSATLDRARLVRLGEMFDDGEPGAVLVRLADEVSNELERARALADAGDHAGVARAAHSIRGSAQMVGATTLASAATELERSATEPGDEVDNVAADLDALHASWAQTRELIEAEVRAERARAGGVSSPNVVD